MKTQTTWLAVLVSIAVAQEETVTTTFTSATSSATDVVPTDVGTPTSSQPITLTVAVGNNGGFSMAPDVIQISPGNYVEWDFYPTNHSVIRAEYGYACVPYELTGPDKIGFYSGQELVDTLHDTPKFQVLINDTNPIFYYCGAPGSCLSHQMVGVINPSANETIEGQKSSAAAASFMLLPGQSWPSEEDPFTSAAAPSSTTSSSTSSATPAPTITSAAPVPTATESHHSSTLSTGAIAGIAIGGAAVLIGAAALIFFCGLKSRRRNSHSGPTAPAMAPLQNHGPPVYPPNYGYMSPSNKHMSVTSSAAPMTDAFGNPVSSDHSGMYGHPNPYQQQSYSQPHMQQNPMGQPANFNHPQDSPANDIFGTNAAPHPVQQNHGGASSPRPGSEIPSVRASSPSSVYATAQGPTSGGIEAFLQKQGRMSPAQEEAHSQGSPLLPSLNAPGQEGGGPPFEMSALRASMNRPAYNAGMRNYNIEG